MRIAADERVGPDRDGEGDEVVVIGIAGDRWRVGWVCDQFGDQNESVNVFDNIVDAKIAPELWSGEDFAKLTQELRADNHDDVLNPYCAKKFCGRAAWRDDR